MAFVLVTLTAVGYFIRFQRPDRARAGLFVMYFAAGFYGLVMNWLIWSTALH